MKLNTKKCKFLFIVKNKSRAINHNYDILDKNHKVFQLKPEDNIKDLGVLIDDELTFKYHIYCKINKSYQMLGIINKNFTNLDKSTFCYQCKSLVRSNLEYANAVWNPFKASLVYDLERLQKRATNMYINCPTLTG